MENIAEERRQSKMWHLERTNRSSRSFNDVCMIIDVHKEFTAEYHLKIKEKVERVNRNTYCTFYWPNYMIMPGNDISTDQPLRMPKTAN